MVFSRARFAFIFTFLILASASIGSVLSMEPDKVLYFGINEQKSEDGLTIKKNVELFLRLGIKGNGGFTAQGCLGKDFLNYVIFETQRNKFEKAFANAQQSKKPITFLLNQNSYEKSSAKVIPLFGKNDLKAFFVKICESSALQDGQADGRLYYGLEDDRKIVKCLADGMKFFLPEDELLGKDIIEVLPENERNAVAEKFHQARKQQKPVEACYSLQGQNFIANIIPLAGLNDYNAFFVEVRQA